jgi:exonuclease III
MKVHFWNVSGLGGKKGRVQLKELISKQRVNVFCLQETMNKEFALSELRNLVGGLSFSWNWTTS